MYIKLAICDDEMEICGQIESVLIDILEKEAIEYDIDVYSSGESLCAELERSRYDFIFLDIEFPDMNGVEVGRYIRENLRDEFVQIAYISSKTEYSMQLFDYRPINFLVKPLTVEKIKKVIDKYMLIARQGNYLFEYKKGHDFFSVPMSDILYFTNNNRKVTIVTKDGSDAFYDSMDNIYSEVKNNRFLFIHKSVIVNYNYVKHFGYKEVIMVDDAVFSISQSRRKIIKMTYGEIKKKKKEEREKRNRNMDYIINNIILLLTNIFELYIVHRFMCIFFRNRCADIKVTILMYFVYFVSGSVVMLVAPYPIMNVMSSVLGLFLVTLCYESSLSKKIVTVIIIFMCMFLSEAIIAALIGMSHVEAFDELENIDALVAIIIEIILWLITLILEKIVKNIKYNMPMPKIFMVAIIMVLVSSVYLEIIIFQQPKLNQVLAKTSLISVIMTNFVMIYLYDSLSREFEERTKSEMIKREKAYYHAQSEMLQKNYGELKQFRHDMKNRMLVMRQMVQNNEIDKMSDYISNLTRKLENTEMFSQTGNIALDSIVNYKLNEAINNGIEVKTNIELPVQLSIDDDDIMIILGNLLDNAIEASNRLQKDKSISLEMEYEKDNMIIEVWNRYDDVIHMENGKIATRKNNKMLHGIGLKSVKATVEKYNGTMDVEHDDDIFSVNIILYFD